MTLSLPKEPGHIKDWIDSVEKMTGKTPGVNWDSLNVWYGNKLPQYLWNDWKSILKPQGFTWQKFLQLLKHRTDAVLLWHKGMYTWKQFIEATIDLIEGPLGKELAKK